MQPRPPSTHLLFLEYMLQENMLLNQAFKMVFISHDLMFFLNEA